MKDRDGNHDESRDDGVGEDERVPVEARNVIALGRTAWPQFIARFTPFVLGCLRKITHDYDERMEIYTYVCDRLAAEDCRRVRQFRGVGREGRCKFTTWLAAVTFNLAREWIRSSKGRRRMFRAIQRLPRIERLVFRYYFWEGYSPGEIARTLSISHGMPTRPSEVATCLESIYRVLGRDHRWRVITRLLRESPDVSIDAKLSAVGEGTGTMIAAHREFPESELDRRRARDLLRGLIRRLPRNQRLALELKFRRGMSARAIAAALDIGNYKRVYEFQARALRTLEAGLREHGIDLQTALGATSERRA